MPAKVRIVSKDAAMRRELAYLQAHEVRVGVLTGGTKRTGVSDGADQHKVEDQAKGKREPLTVADVFSFHELGRGRNPKRSSIVWVIDNQQKEIAELSDKAMLAIMNGKMSAKQALGLIGEKILSLAKMRIKSKIPPPLSVARLRQKVRAGKSGEVPLIHTGQMINSMRWNIVGKI